MDEKRKPIEDEDRVGLPYSIELPDGGGPAPSLSLLSDYVLSVLVSEDAGFARHALVFQLLACYFPVDGFQAQQKCAMTKPAQEEISAIQPSGHLLFSELSSCIQPQFPSLQPLHMN